LQAEQEGGAGILTARKWQAAPLKSFKDCTRDEFLESPKAKHLNHTSCTLSTPSKLGVIAR